MIHYTVNHLGAMVLKYFHLSTFHQDVKIVCQTFVRLFVMA